MDIPLSPKPLKRTHNRFENIPFSNCLFSSNFEKIIFSSWIKFRSILLFPSPQNILVSRNFGTFAKTTNNGFENILPLKRFISIGLTPFFFSPQQKSACCKTILVQLFLLSKNAIILPSSFCFFQHKGVLLRGFRMKRRKDSFHFRRMQWKNCLRRTN